jgi:hypothetical protein
MHSKVDKENTEERKPVAVYDYNQNMGATDLKDQILQPYMVE